MRESKKWSLLTLELAPGRAPDAAGQPVSGLPLGPNPLQLRGEN